MKSTKTNRKQLLTAADATNIRRLQMERVRIMRRLNALAAKELAQFIQPTALNSKYPPERQDRRLRG